MSGKDFMGCICRSPLRGERTMVWDTHTHTHVQNLPSLLMWESAVSWARRTRWGLTTDLVDSPTRSVRLGGLTRQVGVPWRETHIHTHTHTHTNTHTHTHTHVYTYICICTHTYIYIHTSVTHTHVHTQMYICLPALYIH